MVRVLGVGEAEGLWRQKSSASENLKNLRFILLINLRREEGRGMGFRRVLRDQTQRYVD